MFNIYNIVASSICSIGIVGAIILIVNQITSRKGSKKANYCLIGLFSLLLFYLAESFFSYSGFYTYFPHLLFVFFPFSTLLGPAFYFYVLYLIKPERTFKWYDLIHLALMVYILWIGHFSFILQSAEVKIEAFEYFNDPAFREESIKNPSYQWSVKMTMFRIALQIGYVSVSLYLVQLKKKAQQQISANTNIIYLNRFQKVIVGYGIYLFFYFLSFAYMFAQDIATITLEFILFVPTGISIMLVAVLNLKQPERFLFTLQSPEKVTEGIPKIESQNNQEELTARLNTFMLNEKPYLNPELRLHDLAKALNISARKLSNYFNQELKMNFFDFINQYRVEEFKRIISLPESKKYTLIGIAQEVGFNSKASFYRVFKKHTGLTPNEYKHHIYK